LILHEDNFIDNDINARDNRLAKQRFCRFKGRYYSTSFFIFDQEKYKVAREIYFNIDHQMKHKKKNDDDYISALKK